LGAVIAVPVAPRALLVYREQNGSISDEEGTRRYFAHLEQLMASKHDAALRLRNAMACLSYIEPFVRYMKSLPGDSVPPTIPAIPEALAFHAINGARGQIENIREIIEFLPDLQPYLFGVEESLKMLALAASVREHLAEQPGTLQKDFKKAIGATDGRLLSRVLHYMEVARQIERKPHERTWALYSRAHPDSS
jgi:hypothetical protein